MLQSALNRVYACAVEGNRVKRDYGSLRPSS